MIIVENVQPNARERRVFRRGWGAIHALTTVSYIVPYLAMLTLAVIVIAYEPPGLAPWVPGAIIGVAYVAWVGVGFVAQHRVTRAAMTAPAGRETYTWTIDETGVAQTAKLMESRFHWEAVREVREESDRFIFLITPHSNPVLPRRQLGPGQAESLRELVEQARASGRLGRGVD